MCYDCGTHWSVTLHVFVMVCVLNQRVAQGLGRASLTTHTLTDTQLHISQTLLFLDCENERDEQGGVGIG